MEGHKAFSDMQLIREDDLKENKVAIRWTLKLTHGKEFSDIRGVEIFHFENDKIKEAWTIFDALTPAAQLAIVEKHNPKIPSGSAGFVCKDTISSNVI